MWSIEAASTAPVLPAEMTAVCVAVPDRAHGTDERDVRLCAHGLRRLVAHGDRRRCTDELESGAVSSDAGP